MRYRLYDWDGIHGRGEFVRLAIEEAGADWGDVARAKAGEARMGGRGLASPPFAPPFLAKPAISSSARL